MRLRSHVLTLATCFFGLWIVIGCGSGNVASTSSPPATNPAQPPPTMPTPSPTPPAPPPPAGAQTPQFEAAVLRPAASGPDVAVGQVIVNVNSVSGTGHIQATGGVANATYSLTFDPFVGRAPWLVTNVRADASGNINASFMFNNSPFTSNGKGTFSGEFEMQAGNQPPPSGAPIDPLRSGVDDTTNLVFNAPLVQAGQVSPMIEDGTTFGTDPLGSGFVTANQGKLHVELHGAAPNTTYSIVQCGVNGGSSCDVSGSITTDGTGTAISDQSYFTATNPEVVFEFFKGNDLEYVTGFVVK